MVRSGGAVHLEQNPLARALFEKYGIAKAFALLFVLEGLLVAAHWGLAAWSSSNLAAWLVIPFLPIGPACALSLSAAALGHLLAAYSNETGRMPWVMRPVLAVYQRMNARFYPAR